jgi:hypothetical protein
VQNPGSLGILRGANGGAEPRRTVAFEHHGENFGRFAVGQLDDHNGPSSSGLAYRGLTYDSRPGDPHADRLALSADALALDVHSTAEFSERTSRIGAALGASLASGSLQTTLGNEQDNVTVGLGLNAGFGLGFDLTRQQNPDGSQTFGVDLGVSLGGRLDIAGQVTAGALTPEDHAERERTYTEQFPEGPGGA